MASSGLSSKRAPAEAAAAFTFSALVHGRAKLPVPLPPAVADVAPLHGAAAAHLAAAVAVGRRRRLRHVGHSCCCCYRLLVPVDEGQRAQVEACCAHGLQGRVQAGSVRDKGKAARQTEMSTAQHIWWYYSHVLVTSWPQAEYAYPEPPILISLKAVIVLARLFVTGCVAVALAQPALRCEGLGEVRTCSEVAAHDADPQAAHS